MLWSIFIGIIVSIILWIFISAINEKEDKTNKANKANKVNRMPQGKRLVYQEEEDLTEEEIEYDYLLRQQEEQDEEDYYLQQRHDR